jgi:hypothetical protein
LLTNQGSFYAITPILAPLEADPPSRTPEELKESAKDCALLIPAYKAATIVPETIEAALRVFPPEVCQSRSPCKPDLTFTQNIYVIANGNSPTPLDNTEEVCQKYGYVVKVG